MFTFRKNRSQALALLARAEAAAPLRADLVWLYIRVCQDDSSCDPEAQELKLRTLSPTNGVGWLGVLTRAGSRHDDVARDAALAAIGRGDEVDIYWTTLIGHLSMAAVEAGHMQPTDAMLTVTGMVSVIGVPAFAPVSQTCNGDLLRLDDIQEACRGVAHALENGDTVIAELIGVAIAKRVWPENSPEWASATERRRVYEHRSAMLKSVEPIKWNAAQARKFLAFCLERLREQEVAREQLLDAGIDPDTSAT